MNSSDIRANAAGSNLIISIIAKYIPGSAEERHLSEKIGCLFVL